MNTVARIALGAWELNPIVLLACVLAVGAFATKFRSRARWKYFVAALGITLFALLSPLNALADGVLFSAHMAQHLLLLLVMPALFLLSLPRDFKLRIPGGGRLAIFGWAAGVGSMCFWHVPVFCDAAATRPAVHAFQACSLVVMGAAFWWPILAPSSPERLAPGFGIVYLFTACLACTALGIVLTLTPIEVCPVFRAPLAASSWANLRERIGATQDREIGGLLMWLPMCLVYLSAIIVEVGRWLAVPTKSGEDRHEIA